MIQVTATILLLAIGMALPVIVVVIPLAIIAHALKLRGGSSQVSTREKRPLEDDIVKAQWRYDNIWRRR
jgi:hypothetical protein